MSRTTTRRGFTLVELLVVIAIIGILVGMLLPAVQMAREAARRMQCGNNLKQLGLALGLYHDTYKVYPWRQGGTNDGANDPTTSNLSAISGHVMLLPYMEQQALYDQIQLGPPKGGPAPGEAFAPWNKKLIHLRCPSDGSSDDPDAAFGTNNYCFSVGDGVTGSSGSSMSVGRKPRGMFGFNSRISTADINDGASNTLAMSERVYAEVGSGSVPEGGIALEEAGLAASPIDCIVRLDTANDILTGNTAAWSGNRWQDGRPAFNAISTILPPNTHGCSTDVNVGDPGIFPPSSYHPGVVVCLFGDGSVRTINENIDTGDLNLPEPALKRPSPYGVWGAMGSRRGGESSDS